MTPFLYVFLAFATIWLVLSAYIFWMGGTIRHLRSEIDALRERMDDVTQQSDASTLQGRQQAESSNVIRGR